MAGLVSIDVNVTRTASTNTGASVTLPDVPAGYASYLQIYDAVKVHSGLADHWGVAGYIGEEPYEIIEPDTPAGGVQAAPLEWRGEGDPPPAPPPGQGG